MLFEAFVNQHGEQAWTDALADLLPSIHEVDRNATRIWFHFFPLAHAAALQAKDDPVAQTRRLWLEGRPRLADTIDTSHRFLYGHRYWSEVRREILGRIQSVAAPASLDLAALIREIAAAVAAKRGVDVSHVLGITAVALMTLRQVGADVFSTSDGQVSAAGPLARLSPGALTATRARDDSQGPFGFLRGERKEYTVRFDENADEATFKVIRSQEITTAAQGDTRDYSTRDARCHEGPIPVQCRAASCGSCWVGVVAGAEKLSPVTAFERKRIREFGYIDVDEPTPLIRLACQAQAFGNVTIVIPPWNGIIGRFVRGELPAHPTEAIR